MEIIFNPDKKIVNAIREGLKKKDGYCPCRLQKTDDNICMCKELEIKLPTLTLKVFAIVVYIIKRNKFSTKSFLI